jgi:hypothetical protein
VNGIFQRRSLSPQFPRPLRIVPDAGFAQFQLYFGESFLAYIEVKDTP